jgi:uncharacterized membrane protein YvbJ
MICAKCGKEHAGHPAFCTGCVRSLRPGQGNGTKALRSTLAARITHFGWRC